MNPPDSVVKVDTTLKDFFKNWLLFLKPFHELSGKQIQLASAFLEARYELSKKITDDALLDLNVFSTGVKKRIREQLGWSTANFQVIMGDLRRHGFIVNNRINPRYIPNLGENPKTYTLLLYFPIQRDNQEDNNDEQSQ